MLFKSCFNSNFLRAFLYFTHTGVVGWLPLIPLRYHTVTSYDLEVHNLQIPCHFSSVYDYFLYTDVLSKQKYDINSSGDLLTLSATTSVSLLTVACSQSTVPTNILQTSRKSYKIVRAQFSTRQVLLCDGFAERLVTV